MGHEAGPHPVAAEVLVTLAMGAGAVFLLREAPHRTPWLAYDTAHSVMVWVFTLWNRHGTWRPLHESTGAYLDLMILRCHRRVRSATFILGVVAVHAPIAGWLLLNGNAPAGRN